MEGGLDALAVGTPFRCGIRTLRQETLPREALRQPLSCIPSDQLFSWCPGRTAAEKTKDASWASWTILPPFSFSLVGRGGSPSQFGINGD